MKLPEITITEQVRNMRTGRTEIWGATCPGWTFIRTEEPGTPWYARPDDRPELLASFGSLIDARRAAAGNLHACLIDNARRDAERRTA
jgi:hypothetical protein